MKLHDGELCRGLLEDAAKREEILRRDRNLALNDLREVRDQLTEAYRLRDDERAGRQRAEKDRDRLDHEIAEVRDELRVLRARLAQPLIPDGPASSGTPGTSADGSSGARS